MMRYRNAQAMIAGIAVGGLVVHCKKRCAQDVLLYFTVLLLVQREGALHSTSTDFGFDREEPNGTLRESFGDPAVATRIKGCVGVDGPAGYGLLPALCRLPSGRTLA
jgi:hypothetical protein